MLYVCLLMNHLASAALGWKFREQVLTGQPPDISKFYTSPFVSPCTTIHIPTDSICKEEQGRWVGSLRMLATHGHTSFSPSNISSFIAHLFSLPLILLITISAFLHLEGRRHPHTLVLGDTIFVHSQSPPASNTDTMDGDPNLKKRIVTIEPKNQIGRTFLKETEEDGQQFRACVFCAIIDKYYELKKGSEYMKFIGEVPYSTVDEIFTYNEILNHIEKDNNDMESDTKQLVRFLRIAAHQRPLHSS
jgi:hypothetical protein